MYLCFLCVRFVFVLMVRTKTTLRRGRRKRGRTGSTMRVRTVPVFPSGGNVRSRKYGRYHFRGGNDKRHCSNFEKLHRVASTFFKAYEEGDNIDDSTRRSMRNIIINTNINVSLTVVSNNKGNRQARYFIYDKLWSKLEELFDSIARVGDPCMKTEIYMKKEILVCLTGMFTRLLNLLQNVPKYTDDELFDESELIKLYGKDYGTKLADTQNGRQDIHVQINSFKTHGLHGVKNLFSSV